jgi:hypothetical protein
MAFGVQAWDAAGVKTLDTSFRPGVFQGSIVVSSSAAGSQSVPALANGSPFWIAVQDFADFYDRRTVTLSGTTFSWGSGSLSFTIYYGVR